MGNSIQHRIGRNRPPRVQITYDVETGGAIKKQELPFVVGIMANLSAPENDAHPTKLTHPDRKFVEIDRDTFAAYLQSLSPKVRGKAGDESWEVKITSMDDFSPTNLVNMDKVGVLKNLYEKRRYIRDLLTKLDSNDKAQAALNAAYLEQGLPALISQAAAAKAEAEAKEEAEKAAKEVAEDGGAAPAPAAS